MKNIKHEDVATKAKQINFDSYWMVKVQKWAFPYANPRDIKGYCPFFWKTCLALVLAPLILILRGFFKLFKAINKGYDILAEKLDNLFPKREVKSNSGFPKPSPYEIVKLYEYCKRFPRRLNGQNKTPLSRYHYDKKRNTIWVCETHDTLFWAQETENWRDFYQESIKQINANKIKADKYKKLEEKKKAVISVIVKYTNWAVKPLIFAASFYVGRWVYYLLSLVPLQCWILLGNALLGVIVIFFCLAILALVSYSIKIWILDPLIKLGGKTIGKTAYAGTSKTFYFFKEVFGFIGDMIEMLYKKQCPLIIWSGKTTRIHKRKKKQ